VISTHTFPRRCLNVLIYAVVSILVLAAILLSLARLLLPTVEDFKPNVESWVSEQLGQQIQIATLDAAWFGTEPQLVLRGVQVLSEDRMENYGHFQQARLGLDIFTSLIEGRLVPGAFTIEGARFVVLRHKDNHVSVQGISGSGGEDKDQTDLLKDWFFKQRVLDVKNSEIVWRDLKAGSRSWTFSKVNLRFRNHENRHIITGDVSLPKALGSKLKVAIDAQGDLLSGDAWFGNAYVEGADLQLQQWSENIAVQNAQVTNGIVGFKLWTQWRKAQLYSVKGSVSVDDLQAIAKNAANIHVIDHASTLISAQRIDEVWEATLDQLLVSSKNRIWPQTRLDAKFLTNFEKLEAEVSYLDLNETLPVIDFLSSSDSILSNIVERHRPKGLVTNLKLHVDRREEDVNFLAKGVFSHLQSLPHSNVPGVDGLDGNFIVTNHAAKLVAARQAFNFNYPAAYKTKSLIDNFQATILAKYSEDEVQLLGENITADFENARAVGSFSFVSEKKQASPLLDLAFYFDRGEVAKADVYTPSKLISSEVIHWLDQSLRGGRVTSGGIMFYGGLKSFPFKEKEGIFNVNLNVENGELSFAESWPLIGDINGVFDLRSYGFTFYGEKGSSLGSELSEVIVEMPSFFDSRKLLLIQGFAAGDSSFKSQYLHQSPLEDIFAKHLQPLKLEGESRLKLNLAVPLADVKQTRATGLLSLNDNHLFSEEWKLDISELNADLAFSNESVVANDVSGFMGPVAFEGGRIFTANKEDGSHLQISYTGEVDDEGVRYAMGNFLDKSHWGKFLEGKTAVDFNLDIPLFEPKTDDSSKINIRLKSILQNMAVDLPIPLGKQAEQIMDFSMYAELSGKNRALDIQYGNTYLAFEFSGIGDQQRIHRGAVSLSGPVSLPSEHGFRYTGELENFSWTEWEKIIFPPKSERPLFEAGGGGSGISHYFDVSFKNLEVMGSKFQNTKLQASSSAQQWAIHFDGPEVRGKVFVPIMTDRIPIKIKLDHLYVKHEKSKEGKSYYIDPRRMPSLDLSVTDFKYNDVPFGELSMFASKIDAGLFLDRFRINNPDMLIAANGNWTEIAEQQKSEFAIKLTAKNLGNALHNWGYADAIGDGAGEIDIIASWEGKPSDFDFKIVDGNVLVDLKDISLLAFDIGAAKMFGLFIPRRLILDFRDVFKEGMHFDSITGKYRIENGDALTSGLALSGPIADIELAGKIGLVEQDYDQVVTINQHLVSDSLPIVALLANANPVVGASVYVVKKLFETQIDDILSVQYTVLGTWAEPVIEKVEAETPTDTLSESAN